MKNILYFLNPVRLFRRFVIRRGNLNRFRNLVNRSETTGGMTENKSNDGVFPSTPSNSGLNLNEGN